MNGNASSVSASLLAEFSHLAWKLDFNEGSIFQQRAQTVKTYPQTGIFRI